LWVLSGNQAKGKPSSLTKLDPSTGAVLARLDFPAGAEPIKLTINWKKDTLYYIGVNYYGSTVNNGIYKMGVEEANLPDAPFIAASPLQYFWALGIDPQTSNVYVGDPKRFDQAGVVDIYSPGGVKLNTFKVGVGPGSFLFF